MIPYQPSAAGKTVQQTVLCPIACGKGRFPTVVARHGGERAATQPLAQRNTGLTSTTAE